MFTNDWEEFPENDDHLPLQERGWHKRLMERQEALERFNRDHPRFMEKMGRALAKEQQEWAMRMLMGEA